MLHQVWVYLIIMLALMALAAINEALSKILETMFALDIEIPRFPAFLALVAIATVLAWPEIQDHVDIFNLTYRVARIDANDNRFLLRLARSGVGDTQCLENAAREHDATTQAILAERDDNVLQEPLWTPPTPLAPTPGCTSMAEDENQ